jgi:hypothetical protein
MRSSTDMTEPVTLEFLARQIERMATSARADLRELTSIAMRMKAAGERILDEMNALRRVYRENAK